jgi:hypothetical protein
MKKILLLLSSLLSLTAFGQVTTTITPKYGCPNSSSQFISVNVTNTSGTSIPAGIAYNIALTVIENSVTIGTYNQSFTDGFAHNGTKQYTITGLSFGAPSTCTVTGTVSATVPILGSLSYPVNQNYFVQFPPDLTASESPALTISVTGSTDYSVRFYTNQDYNTVTNETTGTTYAVTQSADFSAKAYDPITGCISQNPSNVVSVVTSIEERLGFEVSVYPNPMVTELTISTKNGAALSYEISDLKGNSLQSGSFSSSTKINTEALQTGVYILKVKDASGNFNSYKLTK